MRKFITLEGGEGSGKSTINEKLYAALKEKGYQIMSTREPGGIDIAEQIRNVILNKQNVSMDSKTEALLLAAARRQHLVEKVKPALEVGTIVLCDRFVDSSLVYQGYARGLGMDEVLSINKFAIGEYMPTLTIYLDVSPEVGLGRIAANEAREVNRLDLEAADFHAKVREGYFKILEKYPERIVLIDAERPLDEVFADVLKKVEAHINE